MNTNNANKTSIITQIYFYMKIYKNHIVLFILTLSVLNVEAMNFNPPNKNVKVFASMAFSNIQQKEEDPVTFLKSFFKWYKTKVDYLNNHIFTVNMDFKNNTPYRVNFKQVEKYLNVLKTSGFFSDDYINNYREYFKKVDLTLQKTKQNDGTVDGLDYDPILHSQEPNSMLENLNNFKLTILKSVHRETTIKVETPFNVDSYLIYHLKKTDGKYLITKIDFLISGKIQN